MCVERDTLSSVFTSQNIGCPVLEKVCYQAEQKGKKERKKKRKKEEIAETGFDPVSSGL
jgi:hypothetical protein